MNRPARFALNDVAAAGYGGDANASARFTAPEFRRMMASGALDDIRLELIEGTITRMNPPMNEHAGFQAALIGQFWVLFGSSARLRVRGEMAVDLGGDTIVACDAALLVEHAEHRKVAVAADLLLVIEIAITTADRDLGMKRGLYAAAGISHYWVVDARRSVVHVFGDPADGDYATLGLVPFGQPLAVPGTDRTVTLD